MPDTAALAYLYDRPRQPHEWWRATLPTVPVTPDWEKTIALLARLDDGVSLAVLRGCPDADLTLPAPGTQVFGIQVLLEGAPHFESDCGPVHTPRPGSLVLSQYSDRLGSRVRLPARHDVHIVDLRLSIDALQRLTPFPLAEQLLACFGARGVDGVDGTPGLGGACDTDVAQANTLVSLEPAPRLVSCTASQAILLLAQSLSSSPLADPAALFLWRRARAQELLAHVLDLLATPHAHAPLSPAERTQVSRAIALLDARYAEAWPAARLAKAVGLPEKKLQAGMRALTGTSVHAHLRAVRLRHAADRLARGATVTDVAFDVGYDNLSHFGKAFRAQFGVLPSAYRGQRSPSH